MHGVTRPVTLEVKLSEAVTNPFTGQVTRAATASTKLKRSDFGLTWQMPMAKGGVLVGEEVLVQLEVELTKPSAK